MSRPPVQAARLMHLDAKLTDLDTPVFVGKPDWTGAHALWSLETSIEMAGASVVPAAALRSLLENVAMTA